MASSSAVDCSASRAAPDEGPVPAPERDGAASDAEPSAEDGCGGPFGEASDGSVTPVQGTATVQLQVSGDNEIRSLETTLTVPAKPNRAGTVFVWPGLQPTSGLAPVGDGVLQAVLTWGPTCAPRAPASPYESWWISGEYVNPGADVATYGGCRGGDGALVGVGDVLVVTLRRDGTTWSERIVDASDGRATTFTIDLAGQPQRRALFAIEERDGASPTSAVFSDTRVTFDAPEPGACQPAARGARDAFSVPHASADGRRCCIARIALVSDGAG
jgi:hypothetical protein